MEAVVRRNIRRSRRPAEYPFAHMTSHANVELLSRDSSDLPPPIPQAAIESSKAPPPKKSTSRRQDSRAGRGSQLRGLARLGGTRRRNMNESVRKKSAAALGYLGNLVAVLEQVQEQQEEVAKQDKKVNEVLDELLSTEATYLEDLSFTVRGVTSGADAFRPL